MTAEEKKKITALRRSGYGYKKISAFTHLPLGTIRSYCARNGVYAVASAESNRLDGKACRMCGKTLTQTEGHRKRTYCSDACRVAYWRKHAEPKEQKYCLTCGLPLSGCAKTKKYCSYDCYTVHRWGGKQIA